VSVCSGVARTGALPSSLRRADFLRATRQGRRCATEYFVFYVFDREDAGSARLGITVTRKVGNAVRRNRIKRLVREWFRQRQRGIGACDLVVIAKRGISASLGQTAVTQDLEAALERLRPTAP
jgi:ribonuclease P protein component